MKVLRAPVNASGVPARAKATHYPEPFASRMAGRRKHQLGEIFGIRNFGVNMTRLAPGAVTALHHNHSLQDEFVYVLAGEPLLLMGQASIRLAPGMCVGFPAGGDPHHIENVTDTEVVILEVGDRTAGDEVTYPNDDLAAVMGSDGLWHYRHKDGEPY